MIHVHIEEHENEIETYAEERSGKLSEEEIREIIGDKYADYSLYVDPSLGGMNDDEEDGTFCVYFDGLDNLRDETEPTRFVTEQEGSFKSSGHWAWSSDTVYFAYYYPKGHDEVLDLDKDNHEIKMFYKYDIHDDYDVMVPMEKGDPKVSYDFEITNVKPDWMEGINCQDRKYGLELAEKKTKILEFGRFATQNRKAEKKRKPDTATGRNL